jgi:hypothetical protein
MVERFFWKSLRNLAGLPKSPDKTGLSPKGAPSRGHDFEMVTPDVCAPLDSWSFWFPAPLSPSRLRSARGCRWQRDCGIPRGPR